MRTILRNKTTELYFQGVADWTQKIAEAFDFKSPERVIKFVLRAGLNVNEMEIVFAFDDPRYSIRIPIDERFEKKPATCELQEHSEQVWQDLSDLANVAVLDNSLARAQTPNP